MRFANYSALSVRTSLVGLIVLGCALALVAGGHSSAYAQVTTVLVKGDPAPIAAGVYKGFRRPVASDAPLASLAFESKVRSAVLGGVRGIFADDPIGAGSAVVLRGDISPSGHQFRRLSRPSANALGDVWYQARLSGSERGEYGVSGTESSVVGMPAPAPAAGVLDNFSRPATSGNGDVVFHATIAGAATISGIMADELIMRCTGGDRDCNGGTGTPELLVLKTDPIPDRPGRIICDLGEGVGASTFGIAFRATTKLDCTDIGEVALDGVFRLAFGGAIETVALTGEMSNPSPFVGGTSYNQFDSVPAIEDDGIVAFAAATTGVQISDFIFRCDPGLCPVAPAEVWVESGEVDASGYALSRFDAIGINDAADVVFWSLARSVLSGQGPAIYVKRDGTGTFERIAGKGDQVPDQLLGSVFGKVRLPSMSPGGRIVWRSKMKRVVGGGTDALFLYE